MGGGGGGGGQGGEFDAHDSVVVCTSNIFVHAAPDPCGWVRHFSLSQRVDGLWSSYGWAIGLRNWHRVL